MRCASYASFHSVFRVINDAITAPLSRCESTDWRISLKNEGTSLPHRKRELASIAILGELFQRADQRLMRCSGWHVSGQDL